MTQVTATTSRSERTPTRRIRRGDRRLQLLGRGHRQGAPGRGPAGAHPHRASRASRRAITPSTSALSTSTTRSAWPQSLRGATTLYNTYWVRFPHGRIDHDAAVANSRTLFYAARDAGVQRIVHVSITHPSITSPYPYFRGKAEVERVLAEVGVSYGVLRPAILFGGDGVLLNNIAWLLRRLPVFAVGGRGDYRIRPIHVDDLARLSVTLGSERADHRDRCGGARASDVPGAGLTDQRGRGSHARIVRLPGAIMPVLSSALGLVLRDVLLHREEYLRHGSRARRHRRRRHRDGGAVGVAGRARGDARPELRQRDPTSLPLRDRRQKLIDHGRDLASMPAMSAARTSRRPATWRAVRTGSCWGHGP